MSCKRRLLVSCTIVSVLKVLIVNVVKTDIFLCPPQYFTCLLLILIAQVTAGVLIYFQRDRVRLVLMYLIHFSLFPVDLISILYNLSSCLNNFFFFFLLFVLISSSPTTLSPSGTPGADWVLVLPLSQL